MSTYYYLVCDKHKERTDAASRTAGGGVCHLADSVHTLLRFIVAHDGCQLRSVNEHTNDAYDSQFSDWDEENVEAMYLKERDA
jgi:hypothetical protein